MGHDLVIRSGTIVDGTGADSFTGDLAIDEGVITQVGGDVGQGSREIDADGAIVAPGETCGVASASSAPPAPVATSSGVGGEGQGPGQHGQQRQHQPQHRPQQQP